MSIEWIGPRRWDSNACPQAQWVRPKRCEAGHCPEVMVDEDRISIRSTMDPDKVAVFTGQEWLHLVAEMRSEHPFGVTADRFGYDS